MHGKWFLHKVKKSIDDINKNIYEHKRNKNKRKLKNRDFTIISNNCWAGSVYRYFDLPYQTPTVGLYFFAEDYLKFISDLRYYLSLDLEFIDYSQSKYKDVLEKRNHNIKPIARLDDVEIVFLHYKTPEEAKEKWERRKERVNYDNMIIKFSQMNLCTRKELEKFDEFLFDKKFVFVTERNHKLNSGMYFSGYEGKEEIIIDSKPFPKDINILKLLNKEPCKYL